MNLGCFRPSKGNDVRFNSEHARFPSVSKRKRFLQMISWTYKVGVGPIKWELDLYSGRLDLYSGRLDLYSGSWTYTVGGIRLLFSLKWSLFKGY